MASIIATSINLNKIPKDKALLKENVDNWIKASVKKASEYNISGKELTPFLINQVNKESNNLTLKANVSLIINNALLAGKLAKEYYSN